MAFHGSGWRRISLAALRVCAILVLCSHQGLAQVNISASATQYFFEKVPANLASRLPSAARDLIVAEVHVVGDLSYLVGRDQSGQPPLVPKYRFMASVEILNVLTGAAKIGARYDVYFAASGEAGQKITYPDTPDQKARKYFIASYVDEGSLRRLLGFPISEQEYEKWTGQFLGYERERSRPGTRDR
jgi:hypothetical protein